MISVTFVTTARALIGMVGVMFSPLHERSSLRLYPVLKLQYSNAPLSLFGIFARQKAYSNKNIFGIDFCVLIRVCLKLIQLMKNTC